MTNLAELRQRLAAFDVQALPHEDRRHAAVALVIVEEGLGAEVAGLARPQRWSEAPALLLTKRAAALNRHAGQWALPGGRVDAGETPEGAALRELDEEVGLVLDASAVLGRLDDYATRSGYVITPVVMVGGAARANSASAMRWIAATADRRAVDRGADGGVPLPVARTDRRSRHARGALRSAVLRLVLRPERAAPPYRPHLDPSALNASTGDPT
jgi:ADP-ribose pyrophosphatase YjhB (NUDIX family)